jgi:hypothetical protein
MSQPSRRDFVRDLDKGFHRTLTIIGDLEGELQPFLVGHLDGMPVTTNRVAELDPQSPKVALVLGGIC